MISYEQRFQVVAAIHARSWSGASLTLVFLDFISIPKKLLFWICRPWQYSGLVGVGLGALRKGENEFSYKKHIVSRSIYKWVSADFGIKNRDTMSRRQVGESNNSSPSSRWPLGRWEFPNMKKGLDRTNFWARCSETVIVRNHSLRPEYQCEPKTRTSATWRKWCQNGSHV